LVNSDFSSFRQQKNDHLICSTSSIIIQPTTTTIMRGTAPLRLACTLSRAGPSKHAPLLPAGQAPANTLRTLVSLHHASATFMREPSEISTAFENAHRHYKPEFISYDQYRARALKLVSERGEHGLERLSERGVGGAGARGAMGEFAAPGDHAVIQREIFTPPRAWTGRRRSHATDLTERELKIKEALFGTWERGADAAPRPSLEGVLDVVGAKGATIGQVAHEWKGERVDEDSTEDGM
jgi:hypothetical protein